MSITRILNCIMISCPALTTGQCSAGHEWIGAGLLQTAWYVPCNIPVRANKKKLCRKLDFDVQGQGADAKDLLLGQVFCYTAIIRSGRLAHEGIHA